MADDAVIEAPFCAVCRRSSAVKWRKHVFSRSHQQAAQQFLLSQATRLQDLCDAENWWRCVFCDVAGAAADALAHFGGEQHKARVEAFCRHNRCDADRQMRPQLWLRAARRRELEAALSMTHTAEQGQHEDAGQQEVTDVDKVASERVEAFLTSAATRLEEVQADRRRAVQEAPVGMTREQQQEVLLGPQVATGSRRCKTVTSAEGILQNPLGRHEGERVWGGGIVKLRKAEWVPWTIDQLVKEEQAEHPEMQQTGTEGAAFSHRVTELARGEGLSSIALVSWGANVGNVHTSAVPPWMVQTEEEYKKCNRRDQAATVSAPSNETNHKKVKKRRDIFSELQSKSDNGPGWLPNFGGVWQDGSRSKTKHAFRTAIATAKPSRDRAPRPAEANVVQSPSQRVLPVQSQLPQLPQPPQTPQLLPPQDLVGSVPVPVELLSYVHRENTVIPSSQAPNTRDDEKKTPNPLDAKKQLLVAQKERLRAKMAARRRQ
ncbi:hypothetical protein PRIC2_010859 [Phytophthora ramorum]